MITITVLLFVFTIVSAIAYQSASVENRSIDGRFPKEDVILGHSHKDIIYGHSHVPSNRRAWTKDEILIVAYYAEHYKMTNDALLKLLAETLNRSKSSVVRKMNRLRAVHTGKAKYASHTDAECATLMRVLNEFDGRIIRTEAIKSFSSSIDSNEVNNEFNQQIINKLALV
jgi:hypothetical protein